MEKKTTQRIIGMLVVIALVIILLPLLFGKNDMSSQASATFKPPVGTDQAAEKQVATNSSETPPPQDIMINADGQPVQPDAATPTSPSAENNPSKGTVDISPAMAASVNESVTPVPNADNVQVANNDAANPAPANPAPANPVVSADATTNPALPEDASINPTVTVDAAPDRGAKPADAAASVQAAAPAQTADASKDTSVDKAAAPSKSDKNAAKKKAKVKHPKTSKPSTLSKNDKHNLLKLKSTAWAVQMGNFKNKDNARRLADRLRAAGYKAFTRDIKTAGTTRVYIGPEYQQASASKISSKVEQEFNMHSFIVTLKPLEL